MSMRSTWLPLGLSAVTLGLGGAIYLALRPRTLLMFGWLDAVGAHDLINQLRSFVAPWEYLIPRWVDYSLPTGLWAFSFLLLIGCVWKHDYRVFRNYAGFVGFGIIASELLQLGPLEGTFDWLDLMSNTLGILGAWGVRNAIYTKQHSSRARIGRNCCVCVSRDRLIG